jgi:hypothetical protein
MVIWHFSRIIRLGLNRHGTLYRGIRPVKWYDVFLECYKTLKKKIKKTVKTVKNVNFENCVRPRIIRQNMVELPSLINSIKLGV